MLKTTSQAEQKLSAFQEMIRQADTLLIGAGAGLSTSAGFVYGGERFHRYFADFEERYSFHDMYSGGFCPFPTLEERWAYWSRFVFLNRYCDPPKPVYPALLKLVQDKDYFVLTTNVDHCFQKAGFDRRRLFYTQGDYGLWQCSKPCHDKTYDNKDQVLQMVEAQGFQITDQGLKLPAGVRPRMSVPTELVPHCPKCGAPMSMNLRADNTFVQDNGWYAAAGRYDDFVRRHEDTPVLYLELGVGLNTPGIIKYNFWQQVYQNQKAQYVCVNKGQSYAPQELAGRSLCLNGDAAGLLLGGMLA